MPTLAYLLAMVRLENKAGASVYEFNWGNITTADPAAGFQFPDNPRFFVRNNSHEEGAAAFYKRLTSPTHQRILDAAARDDFDGFFDALTLPHPVTKMAYCPDCRTPAAKNTYRQLVDEYLDKPSWEFVPTGGGAAAAGAGAGGLGVLLFLWLVSKELDL
jgi:hypothetical protein